MPVAVIFFSPVIRLYPDDDNKISTAAKIERNGLLVYLVYDMLKNVSMLLTTMRKYLV